MSTNYFLQTLQHLRQYEEILLFSNLHDIHAQMEAEMISWAEKEFETEKISYPALPPDFDAAAALWAGKIVYTAAQLLLYREHKDQDLALLFPKFSEKTTAGAILSADLFLRFLPDIVQCLENIDYDDALINILEKHLHKWHYSAVSRKMNAINFSWNEITSSNCLFILYVDKIIANKRTDLAKLDIFRTAIDAAMGLYRGTYWKDFKTELVAIENGNN